MKIIKRISIFIILISSLYSSVTAQNISERDSLLADIKATDEGIKKIAKESNFITKLTAKNVASAELFTDSLINFYKENSDTIGWARMLSMKAYVVLYDNRKEELVRLSREAYEMQIDPLRDTLGLAVTLIRMGMGSSYFERYEEAIERTEQALGYFKLLDNDIAADMALNNLGIFKNQIGDAMGAIELYKESAQIRKRLGRDFWHAYALFNIAGAYEGIEEMDSSYAYLLRSESIFINDAKTEIPAMVKMSLAKYHRSKGDIRRGVALLEEATAYSSKIGNTELVLPGTYLLADFYYADGQYKKAYDTYLQVDSMQYVADSMNNAARVTEVEEKYENAKNRIEIEELKVAQFEAEKGTRRVAIILTGLLLLALLVAYRLWSNAQKNKIIKEKEQFELQANLEKTKLLALKSQMNPHFIFNSINIAQSYILEANKEKAYEHMEKFAKLLRLTLDYSDKIFIPIEDEIAMIRLYLELEHNRFASKFEYTFDVDHELLNGVYEVPGMIIQPFVENALIHGVLNLADGGGVISVSLKKNGESVKCTIEDNGVGRDAAKVIKEKKDKHLRSIALYNIDERLSIISKHTDTEISVATEDLMNGTMAIGTRISFVLPLD